MNAVHETRRRVLDAIDAAWEREVEFLRALVSHPSTLGSEAGVQRTVAAELAGMGLDIDTWDIDHAAVARLPGYGARTSRRDGLRRAGAGDRWSSRAMWTSCPPHRSIAGRGDRGRGRSPTAACGDGGPPT